MITVLEYNNDKAHVSLRCRVTRADSQQEFAYEIHDLESEHDAVWAGQLDHLLPSRLTPWCESEELARKELINMVCAAYDLFSTWPQYEDHGYVPGEVYEDGAKAYPPGVNIHAQE